PADDRAATAWGDWAARDAFQSIGDDQTVAEVAPETGERLGLGLSAAEPRGASMPHLGLVVLEGGEASTRTSRAATHEIVRPRVDQIRKIFDLLVNELDVAIVERPD